MTKLRTKSIKFPAISGRQKKIAATIVISAGILLVVFYGKFLFSDSIETKFFWPNGKTVEAEIRSTKQESNISNETAEDPLQNQPAKQELIGPLWVTQDDKTHSVQPAESADSITISKIGAKIPIVTSQTTNITKLHALLDSGAVLYPTSAKFGMIGQTIMLGHSAPPNWPNIKHDTAFSRINELLPGDIINIQFEDQAFEYSVVRTQIIKKGDDLPGEPIAGNSLLLVSCWPPGRNLDRIVVEASWITAGNQ